MQPNVIPFPRGDGDSRVMAATVKAVNDSRAVVDTGEGVVKAQVAFSCLVTPAAGDHVLLSRTAQGYHVLFVLERPGEQDMALRFPADVCLQAPEGRMDMSAAGDMNLAAAGKTRVASSEMHLMSGKLGVCADRLTTRSRETECHVGAARVLGTSIDSVVKRITQRAETIMRWVEGVETLNIGNLIQNIRKTLSSHSHQAVMTAKGDMRIDGERIHMG